MAFENSIQRREKPKVIEYRDFKHFNETNFLSELQSLSNLNLDHIDPSSSWEIWKNKFLHIVNKHAPLKKCRISSKRVPWLTRELKNNKRQKEYLKQKATLSNSEDDWSAYKSLKNSYNRLIKSTIRQHY